MAAFSPPWINSSQGKLEINYSKFPSASGEGCVDLTTARPIQGGPKKTAHGFLCYNFAYSQSFLQRVSIACYAKRCTIVNPSVRLSVRLSVCLSVTRWHYVKTTPATIMRSSLQDSPMTLVSSWLTSARNSKGNLGSEGAEWERGRKIGTF